MGGENEREEPGGAGMGKGGPGRWLSREDNIKLSPRDSIGSFPYGKDGNGFVKQKAIKAYRLLMLVWGG